MRFAGIGIAAVLLAATGCGAQAPAGDGAATAAGAALAPAGDAADAATAGDATADASSAAADGAQTLVDKRAAALVGQEVPPYPDGLVELTGTCISPSSEPAQACSHGIGVLGRMPSNPAMSAVPEIVVASRSLGRDGAKARWQVTDALAHPDAEDGAWLQAGSCAVDGKDDRRIVALVGQDPDAERLPASWARRMDFDSGRFAEVDPATVTCINEAHGL